MNCNNLNHSPLGARTRPSTLDPACSRRLRVRLDVRASYAKAGVLPFVRMYSLANVLLLEQVARKQHGEATKRGGQTARATSATGTVRVWAHCCAQGSPTCLSNRKLQPSQRTELYPQVSKSRSFALPVVRVASVRTVR